MNASRSSSFKDLLALDGLKAENLHALARKTHIRDWLRDASYSREATPNKRTFYLVSGSVELRADDKPSARYAPVPRKRGAALATGSAAKIYRPARDRSRHIMISSDLLDVLLTGIRPASKKCRLALCRSWR